MTTVYCPLISNNVSKNLRDLFILHVNENQTMQCDIINHQKKKSYFCNKKSPLDSTDQMFSCWSFYFVLGDVHEGHVNKVHDAFC